MQEIYQDKLKRINDDEYTLKAIELLINEVIESHKPIGEGSDEEVGQNYKAYGKAEAIAKSIISELRKFTYSKKPKPVKHRER